MDNKDLTLVDRFNLESHNAEKVYENAFNDLKDRRAKDLKNLDKKGENICRYYQFKATDFADVICDLLTLYEGEAYTYQIADSFLYFKCKGRNCFTFNVYSLDNRNSTYVQLLICYRGNDSEFTNITLKSGFVNLLNHNYIKEFIDLVVEWRITKSKKNINKKELKQLEFDFVKARQDEISEVHNSIYKREEMELKKQLDIKKRDMENCLDRIIKYS